MRDKKIGVRIASEAERYFRGHLINPILEIHNTNDELYGLLKNSEIDVLIDDGPMELEKQGRLDTLRMEWFGSP
jgi:polar amino acid transport system substrate-binding protein